MEGYETIQEPDFRKRFIEALNSVPECDYVVGPGRSGAVAAVYASHHLGIPFVPYKHKISGKKALVVDTATMSGKTIRKASKVYGNAPIAVAYNQKEVGHRLKFWYEESSIYRVKGKEYKKCTMCADFAAKSILALINKENPHD